METTASKTATSFDAISTAGELRDKGFEADQAEALAKSMNDSSAGAVVDAVNIFRAEMGQLRAEMGQLRAEIGRDIADMQIKLTATLITAMGIFSAITIAAIRYL